MENGTQQFAFLPYLRTRERCTIRGIEFRSINDVADLDAETKKHVQSLGRMFFTCQNARITEPSVAVIPCCDASRGNNCMRHLDEAQLLLSYLYGAHHPSPTWHDDVFLEAECSTLFTFSPGRVTVDLVAPRSSEEQYGRTTIEPGTKAAQGDFVEGYEGYRNGAVGLWVAEGSRIYPELPNICLNYSQYLDSDVRQFLSEPAHWPFRELFGNHEMSPENQKRVFTALMWYWRSCRGTAGGSERLLSLAIALEALLALDTGDRLTERFKEAVMTLVGPVERLDEWLDQFYRARSKTVHEGGTAHLAFAVRGDKKEPIPHRALIVYGRKVFRICLTAVLSGILLTEESGVESLLIHNNERLTELCKALGEEKTAPNDRVLAVRSIVEKLHQCETLTLGIRLEEDFDKLFGTVRRFLTVYNGCERIQDADVEEMLGSLLGSGGHCSHQTTYEKLGKLRECLRKHVRQERMGFAADDVALRLLEFASRPVVGVECCMRDRRETDGSNGDRAGR